MAERQAQTQLFAEERKQEIMKMLRQQTKLVVPELCDYFGVSASTIRNDLRQLEKEKQLTRTHGGAIISTKTGLEYFPENYGRGRRKQKVSLLRNLRIILDATSVEIFVNDGEAVMSSRYYRNAERMLRFNGEFDMEMYELDLKNC